MATGNTTIENLCTRERTTMKIRDISEKNIDEEVTLFGWVRTVRSQKTFSFIEITDGSRFKTLQLVADASIPGYEELLDKVSTGASIKATGIIVASPGGKQSVEMKLESAEVLGTCPPDYPLQKKRHSFEYLRTIAHLRPRTNTQGAVARVRNKLAFSSHAFFQEKGFLYLQSPIITASDCEGAGEMFQVTTHNLENVPKTEDGSVNFKEDFFGKPSFLTVSGQLNAEAYALAFSDVYTFGPTFRAENSHTSRHLAEFWMIEPEMAFADLNDDMDCAEAYLKYLLGQVLEHCEEDLMFFNSFVEKGLLDRLQHVYSSPFERLTYTDAISILEKSGKKFEYPVKWGIDLQSEHERYIAEEHCKKPVILTDYPKEIKAFYMRDNDDGKTVAAMDVIVPQIGEIIGGSQREERYDRLVSKIEANGLNPADYEWYLDLRKFGSVPHSGFGLGFERLVQFVTGVENIRDAIAFPRVPGNADF